MNRYVVLALWIGAAGALASPPDARPADETARYVNFSYDQVELRILARTVSLATGRRFVVDEDVSGKLTVVTPERIPVDELYPLFLTVLESSGFSAVEEDGVTRILKLPAAATAVGPVVGPRAAAPDRGIITKVLKLHHLSAIEMRKALEPLVRGGREGSLAAVGSTNHLIVIDTAERIRRIEEIVAELDQEGASRTVEVVPLQHASAPQIAAQLQAAMQGAESANQAYARQIRQVTEGGGALPSEFTVVASPEANRVVLVGTPLQVDEAKRVIGELDRPPPPGTGHLHALFLNYIDAAEAADNLNQLLEKAANQDQRRPIAIEPNESNNALLIDASAADFEYVRSLVSQLDRIPKQVMVEILIAEIGEGRNLDLGVEYSFLEEPVDNRTTGIARFRPGEEDPLFDFINQGLFPRGLTAGVTRGEPLTLNGVTFPGITAFITALARDQDVKILSNVPLLAQNNQEATVSVVDNIPLLSSTIEGGSGITRDVIQNIERVDVGIKLTVTPHVNPDGDVLMELNPSIEAIVEESSGNVAFTPTIAKREVTTTLTVRDGQTIVISGLIREDIVQENSRVPILGDIPGLGVLFRKSSDRRQRTNLLVLVTPHVVENETVAQELKTEFERRTGLYAPVEQTLPGPQLGE